jgi:hypothetical protein
MSEWCHGGGQWLQETTGRQRDDHSPTLEWARAAVKATVAAGGTSGGWAGGAGGVRAGDGDGAGARWRVGRRHRRTVAAGRWREHQWWVVWAVAIHAGRRSLRACVAAGVRIWPGRALLNWIGFLIYDG